jgi:glycosyl hydrolase family 114
MKSSFFAITLLCTGFASTAPISSADASPVNALQIRSPGAGYAGKRLARDIQKRKKQHHNHHKHHHNAISSTSSPNVPVPTVSSLDVPSASVTTSPVQSGGDGGDYGSSPSSSPDAPPAAPSSGGSASSTSVPAPSVPVPSAPASGSGSVWQPAVGSTFQIVLSDVVDTNSQVTPDVSVFDVDMFNTPAETIAALKAQGKNVICYFSAGTAENWRPDFNRFSSSDLGGPVCQDSSCSSVWPGENWIDIKNPDPSSSDLPNSWKIMQARIQLAASKGCDAVDPDNMGT